MKRNFTRQARKAASVSRGQYRWLQPTSSPAAPTKPSGSAVRTTRSPFQDSPRRIDELAGYTSQRDLLQAAALNPTNEFPFCRCDVRGSCFVAVFHCIVERCVSKARSPPAAPELTSALFRSQDYACSSSPYRLIATSKANADGSSLVTLQVVGAQSANRTSPCYSLLQQSLQRIALLSRECPGSTCVGLSLHRSPLGHSG